MTPAICALTSGALLTLSLAPWSLWPLALVASALLHFTLANANKKQAATLGWLFGFGLFGSGASWVYVSIHEFGYTSVPLAAFLTLLFCAGLALLTAFSCWLYVVLRGAGGRDSHTFDMWLFATVFVAGEWLRSWLLTGFPWLYIGYSQTEAVLSGYAPLVGVYGIGFILCASGALLSQSLLHRQWSRLHAVLNIGGVIALWAFAPLLAHQQWTQSSGRPLNAAMVQANISQHDKWRPEYRQPTLDLYREMSTALWRDSDLVIWPEAALPMTLASASSYLDDIAQQARSANSALLTGIPYRDEQRGTVHNSATVVGTGEGLYHKQRLVPFGEYLPMENLLGDLMRFFALPMSSMNAGDAGQAALRIGDWHTLPLICYEIVYPSLTADAARHSDALVTISNDAWFGRSLGPLQHLQMAQMRALETGRYVLRSTGTGVSAIISPKAKIVSRSEQFERQTLRGTFSRVQGQTPWVRFGHWLTPLALLVVMAGTAIQRLVTARR